VAVSAAVVGLFAAFGLGALVGIVLLAARRAGRRSALPFGPFLLVGSLVGLVLGTGAAEWYAGLLTGG
jgi:leader peptidase (prepilin peptidase)/N-methyltransferase